VAEHLAINNDAIELAKSEGDECDAVLDQLDEQAACSFPELGDVDRIKSITLFLHENEDAWNESVNEIFGEERRWSPSSRKRKRTEKTFVTRETGREAFRDEIQQRKPSNYISEDARSAYWDLFYEPIPRQCMRHDAYGCLY
jgi:hypothetical protein